uniref:Uncharacterized protein n=1 Tax=Opuntia streptacantha TaxID=393608 RepID=A0A7C9ECG9_OPUST
MTDLMLLPEAELSVEDLFPEGPTSSAEARSKVRFGLEASFTESRGIMRNPEGRRGASSAKEASIGANISSAQVPTAFSSIPLHSCSRNMSLGIIASSGQLMTPSSLITSNSSSCSIVCANGSIT